MKSKAVFRTDASLDIGTGHVMRCLTLADALRKRGCECYFICREHSGHLIEFIRAKGYHVYPLPYSQATSTSYSENEEAALGHAAWLGGSQQEDAAACKKILLNIKPQWLIVDHYALDNCWEEIVKPCCERLMVIDDLADRMHQCDLLLDQTFGRQIEEYAPLVPASCTVLCGAHYALLRPEFSEWRSYSLHRRETPELKQILVTMGGVDKNNATGLILDALGKADLPGGCQIAVVMGATAPWLDTVRQQAQSLSHPTNILTGVNNMAQLMANSDLAIGAAGATSWERCCLGLPTVMIELAENQRQVAHGLVLVGAVNALSSGVQITVELPNVLSALIGSKGELEKMSRAAAQVTDGLGVQAVIGHLR
ncbi:UDP-2,4-diacetamido-2,4,6-trideoxy-beta-L-altropyranose hydrolase [Aestuariicella sp. G3-2]|uniref:UDP-2,4-diacetamido-2,4, 6-trideoxy-beta-L-altropyranose hydrolase n=1 Tax=Pseudomaricurvus albidus TaxID=2842452 RepID=UPI001C0CF0F7|nr:UDP-2,4-diacetamido-2,4,6-trideoxy-beta-L-altropyranose hydrolase [Aestuariicella albida]MBU3071028.1 UDP-2,4-diacetamido-2,4,6-trideoxy-beta-L-altropyranose hydrolase [Aestuariicella albida]